jgi:hypothetical protein
MSHAEQIRFVDPIRELTIDEVQAVSGGADDAGDDDFVGRDGGGPVPTCPGSPGC